MLSFSIAAAFFNWFDQQLQLIAAMGTLGEHRAGGVGADVAGDTGKQIHLGEPHVSADWTGRLAVIMGSEAHGLAEDAPVDTWVRIEHQGRAESLNVAMAATLLVFEAARHR